MSSGVQAADAHPFYFRHDSDQLFGLLHHPPDSARRTAVLLCPAWGHEYMASHRATRQLAMRVAQGGWPVLRFDWRGTGDSGGTGERASLDEWTDDIRDATAELQRRTQCRDVVITGLRLGASLACLRRPADIPHAMVLWDPIVDGRTWLSDLIRQQEQRDDSHSLGGEEIFGAALPGALAAQVNELNLLALSQPPAKRILILDGPTARPEIAALVSHLRGLDADVDHRAAVCPPGWLEPGSSVVPAAGIQTVVGWLKDVID